MKKLTILICLLLFCFNVFAQKADEVLATANGQQFTAKDLMEDAREAWEKLPGLLSQQRQELLGEQIAGILFELESKARNTRVEKLLETEVRAKVSDPPAAQIQAVYDANQAALKNKPLAEVRPQIVAYLRREPEQKALTDFVAQLKAKYKPVIGKDVNTPNLKPTDILATIGGRQLTFKDFQDKNKLLLYELEAEYFDAVQAALQEAVLSALIVAEAKSQNIQTNDLIAREISDKMRDFSDEERAALQSALEKKLFQKYNAKFLLKEPQPIAQNISVDDDPLKGSANAPVTVVMFSDFQCPACAATHPVLKKVIAEYGDKVRFVVRDFPLQMHENAFLAAQAANAANAQGKFFEYVELLYNNQDSLNAASLKEFATKIGLDRKRFDADLDGGKYADEIRKDMADGQSYHVHGTPTIFVNGVKVRTLSAESFRKAIERAMK